MNNSLDKSKQMWYNTSMTKIEKLSTSGRALIVGDIHGCLDELKELLVQANFKDTDTLISVGDIIDRGPKIPETINFLKSLPNFKAVMGNHDYRLFEYRATGRIPNRYFKTTVDSYGGEIPQDVFDFILKAPTIIDAHFGLVVHAGIDHRLELKEQDEYECTHFRDEKGYPWFLDWPKTAPTVFFGHTPNLQWPKSGNAICLDGGCVHGGFLFAYDTEKNKIYSVKAKKNYFHGSYFELNK